LACCHAALAAGREGSGLSPGDAEAEADKAMGLLRLALVGGYRKPDAPEPSRPSTRSAAAATSG
jgi:hypothetical protein